MDNQQALAFTKQRKPKKYLIKDDSDLFISFLMPLSDDIKNFFPRKKMTLSQSSFDAIRSMSIHEEKEKKMSRFVVERNIPDTVISTTKTSYKPLLPKQETIKPLASLKGIESKKITPLHNQEKQLEKILCNKLKASGQLTLVNKLNKMMQSVYLENKLPCIGNVHAFVNLPLHLIIIKLTEDWVSIYSVCKRKIKYIQRNYEKMYCEKLEQFVDQDFGCLNCKSLTQISRGLSLFDLV